MSHKSLLAFTIALILTTSGCLGFGDEELDQQENNEEEQETVEPVSTDNATNQPPLVTAGIWLDDDDFMSSDEVDIYIKYVYVSWSAVDTDGDITSAGFDMDLDMEIDQSVDSDSGTILDSTLDSDHFPGALSMSLNEGWDFERQHLTSAEENDDRCYLVMHRTFAFIAEDDDGASSAQLIHLVADYYRWSANDMDNETIAILGISSDDVDWVTGVNSDCPEPEDNNHNEGCSVDSDCPPGTVCQAGVCVEYNYDICEDGEQSEEGGMIRTCYNGQWGNGEPIFCGHDENVMNHVCVPCPEGSTNEPGDDASGSDTTCDTINHPPVINSLFFVPEIVTNETSSVCLEIDVYDEDDDEITVDVTWIINSEHVITQPADICFSPSDHQLEFEVGDELEVEAAAHDGTHLVFEMYAVVIEEPSEE